MKKDCSECEYFDEFHTSRVCHDCKPWGESAEAVQIHNDGTLEVKVPNAHKVGRVLVMDTDSHIGGGLFYPDDAVEVVRCKECKHYSVKCSKCLHTQEITGVKNYCAVCGARMKGGAE